MFRLARAIAHSDTGPLRTFIKLLTSRTADALGWRELCRFVSLALRHSTATGHPASKTGTQQRIIIRR